MAPEILPQAAAASPQFWDTEPLNDAARVAKLQKISDQLGEVYDAIVAEARLTCPCGRKVAMLLSFQCYDCGIYFCKPCAARHFGEARATAPSRPAEPGEGR